VPCSRSAASGYRRTRPHCWPLLDELGLETYSRYREGESVYIGADGALVRYTGDTFPVSATTAAEMDKLTALLDGLAAEIGPTEPWAHPKARELDTISFHHWLRQNSPDEEACNNIGLFIAGGMLTKPAHAFSALQAVLMAASAGSFTHLTDEDFILDKRVIGGMQQVSLLQAAELGADVVLDSPVRTIHWEADGGTGHRVTAVSRPGHGKRALRDHGRAAQPVLPRLLQPAAAAPPAPDAPAPIAGPGHQGARRLQHAVLARGRALRHGIRRRLAGPGGLRQHQPRRCPRHARGIHLRRKADAVFELSADDRRRAILESIAGFLGDKALEPEVYYESDWGSEEWTRGAYAASYDLGGLHRYGKDQHAAVGPIYWCSSDLAAEGYQHVDGAVRMGQSTAARIAEAAGAAAPELANATAAVG
jgi:putrescine oxidase